MNTLPLLPDAGPQAASAQARRLASGPIGRLSAHDEQAWHRMFERARREDHAGWLATSVASAAAPSPAPPRPRPAAPPPQPTRMQSGLPPAPPPAMQAAASTHAVTRPADRAPPPRDAAPGAAATGRPASATPGHDGPVHAPAPRTSGDAPEDTGWSRRMSEAPAATGTAAPVRVPAQPPAPMPAQALPETRPPTAQPGQPPSPSVDAAIAPQPGLAPDAAPCAALPAPTSPTALQAIARAPVPDTDEAAAEPPATTRRFDPPTGPPEPLRLSAHWTAQGVRIWLGADARALPSLPSVQAAIGPWLRLHGQQLLSLVCNGRPVRPAHAMHGAIPEFSSHPPLIPRETP